MARKGWTVYATARKPETLSELAGKGCRTLALDVCDEASMKEAVAQVESEQGAVGVLVNNAGYTQSGAVEDVPMELVRRQFETNFFGLVRMCQLVLPGMRAQGYGRIVNVSSMGGRLTFPGGGYYHATKHAVEALSDALRFEVAGFGVGVTIVEPGLIRTRFGDTGAASVEEASQDGGGAYAAFNQEVAKTTKGAYQGALAKIAGAGPESVARAIEKSVSRKHPPTRVRVTASARILIAQRRLMPDRAWDAMMSRTFTRPTPGVRS